jgi:hypothetical protein
MSYIGNNPTYITLEPWEYNYNYVSAANPTVSVNPDTDYAVWLNSATGEIFNCTDRTAGSNVWVGQLGTTVS